MTNQQWLFFSSLFFLLSFTIGANYHMESKGPNLITFSSQLQGYFWDVHEIDGHEVFFFYSLILHLLCVGFNLTLCCLKHHLVYKCVQYLPALSVCVTHCDFFKSSTLFLVTSLGSLNVVWENWGSTQLYCFSQFNLHWLHWQTNLHQLSPETRCSDI